LSDRRFETERHSAVRLFDFVHRRSKDQPALMDDGHLIGYALDLVEQVGGKYDRPTFVGNRADDGSQNVAPYDRIEAGGRFVEQQ